jgi:hypothetical protein
MKIIKRPQRILKFNHQKYLLKTKPQLPHLFIQTKILKLLVPIMKQTNMEIKLKSSRVFLKCNNERLKHLNRQLLLPKDKIGFKNNKNPTKDKATVQFLKVKEYKTSTPMMTMNIRKDGAAEKVSLSNLSTGYKKSKAKLTHNQTKLLR